MLRQKRCRAALATAVQSTAKASFHICQIRLTLWLVAQHMRPADTSLNSWQIGHLLLPLRIAL